MANAIITISWDRTPNGGAWTITFDGETTSSLAWNESDGAIQVALEGLSTIGSGNITVTSITGGWQLEFVGALANTAIDDGDFSFNVSSLTSEAGSITRDTVAAGSNGVNEVQTWAYPGTVAPGDTTTFEFGGTPTAPLNHYVDYLIAILEPVIGSGNVSVNQGVFPVQIEFTGAYAATDVPQITIYDESIAGGGASVMDTLVTGEASSVAVQDFTFPATTTGGTYTLGGASLNFSDNASAVESALESLLVTGLSVSTISNGWRVTWDANGPQSLLAADGSGLTAPVWLTAETVQEGSGGSSPVVPVQLLQGGCA